jgi:protein TonB
MKTQEYCYTANEVFDERNKAYGAYPLRKEYANRINKALLGSVLSFVTIITVPTVYRNYFYTPPIHDYISEQVIELTPLEIAQPKNKVVLPPPPPERSTPPPPKAPMQRFTPLAVAHDNDAT